MNNLQINRTHKNEQFTNIFVYTLPKLLNFHLEDVIKPLDEQIHLYLMSENSSTGIYNLNDKEFEKCLIPMFLL